MKSIVNALGMSLLVLSGWFFMDMVNDHLKPASEYVTLGIYGASVALAVVLAR